MLAALGREHRFRDWLAFHAVHSGRYLTGISAHGLDQDGGGYFGPEEALRNQEMKEYLIVLEKLTPLFTAIRVTVDDGVADAVDAAELAALDEASATGAVRVEPRVGSWSLRCPPEATGYQVPFESEPEVIMMRRVSGEIEIVAVRETCNPGDQLAILPSNSQCLGCKASA